MKQPFQNKRTEGELGVELESQLRSFQARAKANGLAFDESHFEKMLSYIKLLLEWNRAISLISRGDEAKIVSKHIAESAGLLLVAGPAAASQIMDIGSGGGFPAVPMKILRPDLRFTLVESNGKKTTFLKSVAGKLHLENFVVLHSRVESLGINRAPIYSLITARAVAELSQLWKWTKAHLVAGGRLVVIKGGDVSTEIAALSGVVGIANVTTVKFPDWLNIEKSRCAISVVKNEVEQT